MTKITIVDSGLFRWIDFMLEGLVIVVFKHVKRRMECLITVVEIVEWKFTILPVVNVEQN